MARIPGQDPSNSDITHALLARTGFSTIAVDVQTDAVKSERWAAAGKKIMGPPHDDVKPNTTGEDGDRKSVV